jgi:protein KRI1
VSAELFSFCGIDIKNFAMEPPTKRPRKLLDDSGSESEGDDGPGEVRTPAFKINEEYARRFEHNKKREELQQCIYV